MNETSGCEISWHFYNILYRVGFITLFNIYYQLPSHFNLVPNVLQFEVLINFTGFSYLLNKFLVYFKNQYSTYFAIIMLNMMSYCFMNYE